MYGGLFFYRTEKVKKMFSFGGKSIYKRWGDLKGGGVWKGVGSKPHLRVPTMWGKEGQNF